MANARQLAILRQGVKAWNEWRYNNPEVEIDLSGADLSGADLYRANLSIANLFDANLRGANLSRAKLRRAILPKANLARANLRGAKLREASLRVAKLIGANLIGANLIGADLRIADLRGSNVTRAQLMEAITDATTLHDLDDEDAPASDRTPDTNLAEDSPIAQDAGDAEAAPPQDGNVEIATARRILRTPSERQEMLADAQAVQAIIKENFAYLEKVQKGERPNALPDFYLGLDLYEDAAAKNLAQLLERMAALLAAIAAHLAEEKQPAPNQTDNWVKDLGKNLGALREDLDEFCLSVTGGALAAAGTGAGVEYGWPLAAIGLCGFIGLVSLGNNVKIDFRTFGTGVPLSKNKKKNTKK